MTATATRKTTATFIGYSKEGWVNYLSAVVPGLRCMVLDGVTRPADFATEEIFRDTFSGTCDNPDESDEQFQRRMRPHFRKLVREAADMATRGLDLLDGWHRKGVLRAPKRYERKDRPELIRDREERRRQLRKRLGK